MIKLYEEAVQYLYDNLPMFQRVGAVAFKKDLTNTLQLCHALGDPQTKFRSIHIAGTNGKGSTSNMLASVLQEAGYKTGLYTSPHLKSFTERIKVNGRDVSEQFVVDFVNKIRPVVSEIQPSFFELTVAMAFDYFAQQRVDVAVVEVGLGGRLDSTNVITPLVSVITNIGWDHKDLLGDTLPKIASEKAGIIKRHVPVVVSERQPDVESVFITQAQEKEAKLYFASDEYRATTAPDSALQVMRRGSTVFETLRLPLTGLYQQKNLPGVLKAIDLLSEHFPVTHDQLRAGLENVIVNTNFKGRWQKLRDKPLMICDTGHNIDGIREIVRQLGTIAFRQLHIVFGVVKDKDVTDVLALLPKRATYYFCQAQIPRAMEASVLAEKARHAGLRGEVIPDVNEAKRKALKNASQDDLIFIGGSTFVVAEIEEL
nr:folylpolyglutamate synthase/dihydrofolate synthase family protein [Chryseosolibacter histidini]